MPLTVIEEEDVPLSRTPIRGGYVDIFDEEVPLAAMPKTGDSALSDKGLLGVMVMSFLGAVGLMKNRKKDEN